MISLIMNATLLLCFFNDTVTTEIYTSSHTLSLHDARPIGNRQGRWRCAHRKISAYPMAVDGLTHARKARTVADRLRKMPGIVEAEASAVGEIGRAHV